MGHIFISYSRKDEEYVNKLVDALENEGFDVWIDREMLTGAEWIRVINHKIDTCDAFVIVLTKDSKESKWVNRELLYALQEEKRIFPLLRQGRLWMQLQDLNYFDVRNGSIPNKKFFNDVSKIIPRSERWLKAQQEKENQSAIREQAETERKRKIAREKAEKEAVEIYRNEAAKRQKDAEREEKRNLFLSTVGSRFSTFNVYFRKIFIPAFLLIAVLIGMVYYGKSVYDDFMLRATPLISQVPTSQTSLIVTETNIVAIPSETLSVTFTPDITSTPTSLPTEITDAKGITMRLVREGEFTMGSENRSDDEKPIHQVYLETYHIDKYEVTNTLYKACVDAGVCDPPASTSYYNNSQYAQHPVAYVNWNMAKEYCEWRGARLPTEAEWEKAARGTDGRTYPWGESFDSSYANYSLGVGDTTPVGNYPKGISPYGAYDMVGNVWEWVADWYGSDYYGVSPDTNPLGPDSGSSRVLRGGSAKYSVGYVVRSADRYNLDPASTNTGVGFRCARSIPIGGSLP